MVTPDLDLPESDQFWLRTVPFWGRPSWIRVMFYKGAPTVQFRLKKWTFLRGAHLCSSNLLALNVHFSPLLLLPSFSLADQPPNFRHSMVGSSTLIMVRFSSWSAGSFRIHRAGRTHEINVMSIIQLWKLVLFLFRMVFIYVESGYRVLNSRSNAIKCSPVFQYTPTAWRRAPPILRHGGFDEHSK